jgi:8-oxo-dGTP diphosphatase
MTATSGRLVVAAVVLIDDLGRIALVRKRGTQRFMLPGGKIEQGEAPEDCAVREAAEELGAHLVRDQLSLLGAWEAPAANEPGHRVHGHVFAHPQVTGLAPRGEIDELVWLRTEEADGRDDLAPLFQFRVLPVLRGLEGGGMAP